MRYVSTRGTAPALGFADVLLTGLADDGGLYVPELWPALDVPAAATSYQQVAAAVMWPYVEGSIERAAFDAIVDDAYAQFHHPGVCPVEALDDGIQLCELYWGPTLAFKDVALQLVGRLFDHELARRGERATIVVATSGDTGSAAIEACRGRSSLDIVVLHPRGRVSDVQRRQMTTVDEPNVHNVAIDGTFDDCQDLVKALFADAAFRTKVHLSAMNSINWARVMAQIVYYVTSHRALMGAGASEPITFAVPTGNFGNVFAGWVARRMGLPVDQLLIGSNRNDILPRWLATGTMTMADVVSTVSPSMDIQVSSNLERLLFELAGRDGEAVTRTFTRFRSERSVTVADEAMDEARAVFRGARFDDEATLGEIRAVHERTGRLVDPHTAVGLAAARALRRSDDHPTVVLATAGAAKFPDAVEQATGVRPPLPEWLADLHQRREHCTALPYDVERLRDLILDRVGD